MENHQIERDEGYGQARQRNFAMLKHGYDLGTKGQITWKRDEIHND